MHYSLAFYYYRAAQVSSSVNFLSGVMTQGVGLLDDQLDSFVLMICKLISTFKQQSAVKLVLSRLQGFMPTFLHAARVQVPAFNQQMGPSCVSFLSSEQVLSSTFKEQMCLVWFQVFVGSGAHFLDPLRHLVETDLIDISHFKSLHVSVVTALLCY